MTHYDPPRDNQGRVRRWVWWLCAVCHLQIGPGEWHGHR